MKNKTKFIILGVILGFLVFLIVPVFPVSFPNMDGTKHFVTFFSGLKVLNLGFGLKSFLLHEFIGGIIGFLFPFLIVKDGK